MSRGRGLVARALAALPFSQHVARFHNQRLYCGPKALPRILGGYAVGGACYAAGRILCVRGRVYAGHLTHCGVHVFANLGNLVILPFALR